jgi:hypothetical protein
MSLSMADRAAVAAFPTGDLWQFCASVLDEWLPSGVSSNRHSCRQHERKVSLFTRTRYRYESLKVKEREEGEEVWEFSYYETDAEGKRQRRAAIVASREEYATESAHREEPAVRVILLRLNAEQPTASGAMGFGSVIARY